MRAATPSAEGFAEHGGVRIGYQVYDGPGPAILLMPTWTVIHTRFWKAQIPYLARHFRVVVYDGPGNGRSDRPLDRKAYDQAAQVGYALAVLDATGTERAVLAGLSRAANWALDLAATHPERVHGTILFGPALALSDPSSARVSATDFTGPAPDLPPSGVPGLQPDPDPHWAKYNQRYWSEHHEDFLWFFFGQCYSEPHSTKPIEDAVGWGLETTPQVLIAESRGDSPGLDDIHGWCERLTRPLLIVHGADDRIVPLKRSEILAELTGGELVVLEGSGHLPMGRDPVQTNRLIADFAARFAERRPIRRSWTRPARRPRRVLYLSSPIGLGHARRDLAIAQQLRTLRPGVRIDWLTQHPVTRFLQDAGETVHPASSLLANESAHIESEAGEHDLHCFQALRRMDEILVANFMVFHDLVQAEDYDLVVGDEAWDVDHFLHENPELKRFAYAWMTDFVGFLPMPDGGRREALVAADHNAEMIEHIARSPRLRDRAIFVGDPEDVVDQPFGPDLPSIRAWTEEHYDFAGYVTGGAGGAGGLAGAPDRERLRAELGYRPGESVCVVTVGGSGVGGDLLGRVLDAAPGIRRQLPALRLVVVTGPRIDPASLTVPAGVELHGYVPDLDRHLAACDLAIVQGGLTTCMELTAAGRPFVYVPLRHHFEQNVHVAHRLERHHAGLRLDFDRITPESLTAAIRSQLGRRTEYRPVPVDGARRAAGMLNELF